MKNISLLEVSYEVANKVGGINTVLKSKIREIQKNVSEYITIGPYYREKADIEFRQKEPPMNLRRVFENIENSHGIKCYYGLWLAEEQPLCILVDFNSIRGSINDIKRELWDQYKIDSLNADSWYDEPIVWSRAVGIVIEEMLNAGVLKHRPIAHFHEWLTGAGLLYLNSKEANIGTVFTTHSTVLGRAIAEVGREDLYNLIDSGIKEDRTVQIEKAYEYRCESKHLMESACAQNADVFSAVSETIEKECIFMLGKKPDIILPNGLNMDHFPKPGEIEKQHEKYSAHIKGFVEKYFSKYYKLDPKDMVLMYISGRFEFRNKGIDVFIDALGNLNERLGKSNKYVIVFILVPAYTKRRDGEHKGNRPPISPFVFGSSNAITEALERNGLQNSKTDKVKVIFYPIYLSKSDGLVGLDYYDAVKGFDLGVFPSYYESWGYTPLETAASGIQSVTTDLSGFGRFIMKNQKKGDMSIIVLHRDGAEYEDIVDELEEALYKVATTSEEKMLESRTRAKELSLLCDWSLLIKHYLRAYDMALRNS